MTDFKDLPEEVRDVIAPHLPQSESSLAAISRVLSAKRDEAKAARANSGIEAVWQDAEEAYLGVDDENRSEFQNAKWAKPMSPDGPVTTGRDPGKDADVHSTVFVRLTSRYVDAGASKLTEILLPPDDKPFSFSEMPVPELVQAKDDNSWVIHDGMGNQPLFRRMRPDEIQAQRASEGEPLPPSAPQPPAPVMGAVPPTGVAGLPGIGNNGGPPMVPLTVKDLAEEAIEIARKKAKKAEQRIYDWLVECHHQAETRKVIFDSARIGVGVLKGPVPKFYRSFSVQKAQAGISLLVNEVLKPSTKWVDPWNIFPDPSCGEEIHNGDYIFERDHLSAKQVEALKDLPGYVASEIDKVLLEEPPENAKDGSGRPGEQNQKGRYEIWYYYGTMKSEEFDCICAAVKGKESVPKSDTPNKKVHAVATMIGSRVVKAVFNPLETGHFPYRSMPWQRRAGSWAGIGIGEQAKTPQRMLNAATRSMLNNAGISAGGQIIIDLSAIKPSDGDWTIYANKVWFKTGDNPNQSVADAFTSVAIENVTEQLMKVIEYALKLAEESTNIPLITQGQSGATTPDTFGGMQLQNNNANQLLRSIGYSYDNHITEPLINDLYEWLLLDPDVPDDEKGDFKINAHGSVALVERAIQDQTIAQMAPMVANPVYGADPRKWFALWLKSKRINPEDVQYSKEEQARIDAKPPPIPPPVQVAQTNQKTQLTIATMKQSTAERSDQNESQIAAAERQLEGDKISVEQQRTATEATIDLHDLHTRREIAMLEHATKRGMTLAQLQAELTKTRMTLDAAQSLNIMDNAVDVAKHKESTRAKALEKPPVQAPGRAGNGRAFEQGR